MAKRRGDGKKARDVLAHDEEMARAVEQRVHAVAPAELASDAPPAATADRLVELAAADLLKREVEQARAVRHEQPPPGREQEPASLRATALQAADSLAHKAEQRLEALPEPIKKLGRAAERTAGLVLWPARFAARLVMELVRTPMAFARILLRSREA